MAGVQSEIFQGRGGLGELGHIGKHFVKNFNPKMDTTRDFFPKSGYFYDFEKRAGEASPLVARLKGGL